MGDECARAIYSPSLTLAFPLCLAHSIFALSLLQPLRRFPFAISLLPLLFLSLSDWLSTPLLKMRYCLMRRGWGQEQGRQRASVLKKEKKRKHGGGDLCRLTFFFACKATTCFNTTLWYHFGSKQWTMMITLPRYVTSFLWRVESALTGHIIRYTCTISCLKAKSCVRNSAFMMTMLNLFWHCKELSISQDILDGVHFFFSNISVLNICRSTKKIKKDKQFMVCVCVCDYNCLFYCNA